MNLKQFFMVSLSFVSIANAASIVDTEESLKQIIRKYTESQFLNLDTIPGDLQIINDLGAGIVSLLKTEKGMYFLGGTRRVFGLDSGSPKFKLSVGGKVLEEAASLKNAVAYRRDVETFGLLSLSDQILFSPLITIVGGGYDKDDGSRSLWGPYVTLFAIELGYDDAELHAKIDLMNRHAEWYDRALQLFKNFKETSDSNLKVQLALKDARGLNIDNAIITAMQQAEQGLSDEQINKTIIRLYDYTKTLKFKLIAPEKVRRCLKLADAEYRTSTFESRQVLDHALSLVSFDR